MKKKAAGRRPTTIAEYIAAAPAAGQPHLRRVYAILKSVAPGAQETIKWNAPFFVEPRFLFSFSAFKKHLAFAPMAKALDSFRKELEPYDSTTHFLKIPYDHPLPEALIRKIAKHCVRTLKKSDSDSFW